MLWDMLGHNQYAGNDGLVAIGTPNDSKSIYMINTY